MSWYRRTLAGPFGVGLLLAALGTALPVAVHHVWAPPAPEATATDFSTHLRHVRQSLASVFDHWLGDLRQPSAASEAGEGALMSGFTAAGAGLAVITAPIPVDVDRTPHSGAETSARLTRSIQAELQRVGCYGGRIHGTWDHPTRSAMLAFKGSIGSGLRITGPDYVLLTMLQGQSGVTCGRPCGPASGVHPSAQCPSVVASSASADRAHFGDRTPSAAFVTPPTLPTSLGPWPRDGRASIPARSADPLALQQSADALEVVPTPAAKYSPPKSVARPAPVPQRTREAAAATAPQGSNSP